MDRPELAAIEPEALPLLPPLFRTPFATFGLSLSDRHSRALAFVVLAAVAILLVTARLLLSKSTPTGRKSKKKQVVLVGPVGCGKTRVWTRMVFGREAETVTSLQDNKGIVQPAEKAAEGDKPSPPGSVSVPVTIIDTPGHPRLRARSIARAFPRVNGVVFVLDPSTSLTGRGIRDAGEHLQLTLSALELLAAHPTQPPLPPLLILLASSPSSTKPLASTAVIDRARTALNRELARRRSLLASSAAAAGGAASQLEGLEAIATPSSSSPWWTFGLGSLFSSDASVGLSDDGKREVARLPEEEGELLAKAQELGAEVITIDGDKAWAGGIQWAVREGTDGADDGLGALWEWIEGLQ